MKEYKDIGIKIGTYSTANKRNPEIVSPEKIDSEKIKKYSLDKKLYISNLKEKNGLIFIISHKINPSNDKTIVNYVSLNIDIIKNSSDLELMNHIEIPRETQIKFENFTKLKFLDYDVFKINENISFLFILLINDFYLYKIWKNPENDSINYKKLEFEKKKKKIIFLGNYKNENNILEYAFITKPDNNFIYFNFNLSDLIESDQINYKIEEKSLKDEEKNRVLLKRLKRGEDVDKYIIEEDQKFFILYKDENNINNMLIFPFEIVYKDQLFIKKLKNQFYLKFLEKMFLIIDLTDNENINKEKNQILLGIFEIQFNKEKNIYTTKLSQEITINKNKEYDVHYLSNKQIMVVVDKHIVYYITLNYNCFAEKIYKLIFDKSLKIRKNAIYEDDNLIRFFWFNNNEIFYISINKSREDVIIPSIQNFESFINSYTKEKLNSFFQGEYSQAKEKYNSIKKKMKAEKLEVEKNENNIEKISKYLINVTQEGINHTNNNYTNNEIKEEINLINNNKNQNINQFNINSMNLNEQINYFNQLNQINQYKYNLNNSYNQINPINTLDQINFIDPRFANQLNINNLYQQINPNQFNNIQNLSNINIYSSLLDNRSNINPNL